MEVKNALIVVAHPDDEVLGMGATAASLIEKGWTVRACILSATAGARTQRPTDAELSADIKTAQEVLGLKSPILGDFPNIEFNTVPHLKLVQFIENAIRETGSQVLFTHHPGDLNIDHRCTSEACQAAARLSQRNSQIPKLQGLYYLETPSGTDWSFRVEGPVFRPTAYFEIGEAGLQKKMNALECYRNVLRPFPHPRSVEAIRGLAAVRGGESGLRYAEAFETAFQELT